MAHQGIDAELERQVCRGEERSLQNPRIQGRIDIDNIWAMLCLALGVIREKRQQYEMLAVYTC